MIRNSKLFVSLLTMLTVTLNVFADDMIITRDGKIMEITLDSINAHEVSIKKQHNKRGSSLPTDFVFMILREKGTSYFFDEDG